MASSKTSGMIFTITDILQKCIIQDEGPKILIVWNQHLLHIIWNIYNDFKCVWLLQHSIDPWQTQNVVHASFALLHPHAEDLHGLSLAQLHFINLNIWAGASCTFVGTVIGISDIVSFSFLYPYNVQSKLNGCVSTLWAC